MTRIIAGAARGRRLAVPGSGTRPTSDRVREALFSALESEWAARASRGPTSTVLDLYAGTGALGLEALSRGATRAQLVESVAGRGEHARGRTCAAVGCPESEVVVRDAAQVGRARRPRRRGRPGLRRPALRLGRADRWRRAGAPARGWLDRATMPSSWSSARPRPGEPLPDAWPEPRRRTYGDTVLWYGRVRASEFDWTMPRRGTDAHRRLPGVLRPRDQRAPRRVRAGRGHVRRGRGRRPHQPHQGGPVHHRRAHRDAPRGGRPLPEHPGRLVPRAARRLLQRARHHRDRQGPASRQRLRLRAADGPDELPAGGRRDDVHHHEPPLQLPVVEPGQGGRQVRW